MKPINNLRVAENAALFLLQKRRYDKNAQQKIRHMNNRNIFEDWVRHNGEPILFATERGALEYMHGIEMKTQGAFTEFEVREVI